MQAYEGYLENGRFYPLGDIADLIGRFRVIMTVIDDSMVSDSSESLSQEAYLAIMDELCGSIDDPTFVEFSRIDGLAVEDWTKKS